MNTITYATPNERQQILDFLETHSLEANAWLLWFVFGALSGRETLDKVIVCRRDGIIAGVAHLSDTSQCNPAYKPNYDYRVEMDALDEQAAEVLVQSLPEKKLYNIVAYNRDVQIYLDRQSCIERSLDCLYFTVSADIFRPVPSPEVVELTEADDALFEGCESRPIWENARHGGHLFAIVRDGRVATHLWVGVLAPEVTTKRHVETICAVHTQTPWRQKGLGKQLVSHVTGLILQHNNAPLYWTDPDNIASQSLCKSLGFYQYSQSITYLWRKE